MPDAVPAAVEGSSSGEVAERIAAAVVALDDAVVAMDHGTTLAEAEVPSRCSSEPYSLSCVGCCRTQVVVDAVVVVAAAAATVDEVVDIVQPSRRAEHVRSGRGQYRRYLDSLLDCEGQRDGRYQGPDGEA